ncbi:MAG: hypothetical protein ACO3JL_08230, partial [Myxococcota bacterium]
MALVRCPQCGRVADGDGCLACGYEWSQKMPAAPAASVASDDVLDELLALDGIDLHPAPGPDDDLGAVEHGLSVDDLDDWLGGGGGDEDVRAMGTGASSSMASPPKSEGAIPDVLPVSAPAAS